MANLFDLPRYIAVEGPIRVGKSTLARVLAERLNAQRVMEPEDNAFLPAFYKGEPGAAFQTQFTFLVRRFEQLRTLDVGARSQKAIVTDFIFEKDKLFACLNLNDVSSRPTIATTICFASRSPRPTWSFICKPLPKCSRNV